MSLRTTSSSTGYTPPGAPDGGLSLSSFYIRCPTSSRFRTQLCSFGVECKRSICFFAHQPSELRVNDYIAQLQALERDLEASDPAFAVPNANAKWGAGTEQPFGAVPKDPRQGGFGNGQRGQRSVQTQQQVNNDFAQLRNQMHMQVREMLSG